MEMAGEAHSHLLRTHLIQDKDTRKETCHRQEKGISRNGSSSGRQKANERGLGDEPG